MKNEVCDHTFSNKRKTGTVRGRNLGALPDGEEPSILLTLLIYEMRGLGVSNAGCNFVSRFLKLLLGDG